MSKIYYVSIYYKKFLSKVQELNKIVFVVYRKIGLYSLHFKFFLKKDICNEFLKKNLSFFKNYLKFRSKIYLIRNLKVKRLYNKVIFLGFVFQN